MMIEMRFKFDRSSGEGLRDFRCRCLQSLEAAYIALPRDINAKIAQAVGPTTMSLIIKVTNDPGPPMACIEWIN